MTYLPTAIRGDFARAKVVFWLFSFVMSLDVPRQPHANTCCVDKLGVLRAVLSVLKTVFGIRKRIVAEKIRGNRELADTLHQELMHALTEDPTVIKALLANFSEVAESSGMIRLLLHRRLGLLLTTLFCPVFRCKLPQATPLRLQPVWKSATGFLN